MTPARGEEGYALVAAVASIAVFGAMAVALILSTRSAIVAGGAEVEQARAAAAADAAVTLAIRQLLASPADGSAVIDGRPRRVQFGRATLTFRVEDERGKVPLSLLDEDVATRLLSAVGLEGKRLRIARDSLLDWTDEDGDPRPDGAESAFYAPRGYAPADGPVRSIDEAPRIRGFDAALVERMRPLVTANFGRFAFDSRFAQPLAITIMRGEEKGAVDAIDNAREAAGQKTAIAFSDESNLIGRPLQIVAQASLPGGGSARRRVTVELTGAATRPYVVRSYE